jgi:hypothetical protein
MLMFWVLLGLIGLGNARRDVPVFLKGEGGPKKTSLEAIRAGPSTTAATAGQGKWIVVFDEAGDKVGHRDAHAICLVEGHVSRFRAFSPSLFFALPPIELKLALIS